MTAPNLRTPTTITGRTARYAVTTTLANALANAANSNRVLKVNSVYCANIDGVNTAEIDLSIFDGTTDTFLARTVVVPADATQLLVTREGYIYLEEGFSLRARASAAGDLEMVIGYEEIS